MEKQTYYRKPSSSEKFFKWLLTTGTLAGLTLSVVGSATKNPDLAKMGGNVFGISGAWLLYYFGKYTGEKQFYKTDSQEVWGKSLVSKIKEFYS